MATVHEVRRTTRKKQPDYEQNSAELNPSMGRGVCGEVCDGCKHGSAVAGRGAACGVDLLWQRGPKSPVGRAYRAHPTARRGGGLTVSPS